MDRSPLRALISLGALSWLLLPFVGCIERVAIDVPEQSGALSLDPGLLRPDYQGLGSQPRSGDRATDSDGNAYDDLGNRIGNGGLIEVESLLAPGGS